VTTDLSPDQLATIAHLADPGTLAERCTRGNPEPWVRARHLDLIARTAARIATQRDGRLICNVPPRHGKSFLLTVWLPVWYLALWPHHRVIVASYGSELARRWGRLIRDIVREHGDLLLGLRVSDDSSAADRWHTPEGGGLLAAGVGGGIIGWGANLLIVDDPLANAEEASSAVIRERVWDWWVSTARTRVEPGGAAVVDLQRWHVDDLAGKLLKAQDQGGEEWETLVLPAIAERADDPLGRKPGEPLWPERYDVAALNRLRTTDPVAATWWDSQYQQHPRELGGGWIEPELVRAATDYGVTERPRDYRWAYHAFADVSGGRQDSYTLAIAHWEPNVPVDEDGKPLKEPTRDDWYRAGGAAVLDLVMEWPAPCDPDATTVEACGILERYGLKRVSGDRYGGEWVRARYKANGVTYFVVDVSKSVIYQALLPLLVSGTARLVDSQVLREQLVGLDRRVGRSGHESIDHAEGGQDDVSNAAAGALVAAAESGRGLQPKAPPVEPAETTNELLRRRIAENVQKQLQLDDKGKPKRGAGKAFKMPWQR
jgi:hypothetical protein